MLLQFIFMRMKGSQRFSTFRVVQLIRSELNNDIKKLTDSKEGLETIISLIKPWIGWKIKDSRESLFDFV